MPVDKAITKNINNLFISDLILAEGVDQDQQLTFTFSEAERAEKLEVNWSKYTGAIMSSRWVRCQEINKTRWHSVKSSEIFQIQSSWSARQSVWPSITNSHHQRTLTLLSLTLEKLPRMGFCKVKISNWLLSVVWQKNLQSTKC